MKLMNVKLVRSVARKGSRLLVALSLALAGSGAGAATAAAATDAIVGRYDVDAFGVARVDGHNYWGSFSDRFRFDANHKFAMKGITGSWKKRGSSYSAKLINGVESRIERELREQLSGVRVTKETLELRSIRVSEGTIRGDIKGTIDVKYRGMRFHVTAGGRFTGQEQ